MQRRDLLKAGAAGAAALATGCATGGNGAQPTARVADLPVPEARMDVLCRQMDELLAGMRQASLTAELMPGGLPQDRAVAPGVLAAHEDFVQRSVKSLYVSGMFLDQPEHARKHAGLQQRVIDTLPDMDSSLRDGHAILASLDDEQHAQVRAMLQQRPELGMHVAEALDARAAEVGISRKRRMQLRMAAMEITTRMRRQHPATVVHEYLAKTEKVYERHGATELQRSVSTRAGEQLFWARVARAGSEAEPYVEADPSSAEYWESSPQGSNPPPQAARLPPEPRPKPGQGALVAAGWMFGIGVAFGVVGFVVIEAGNILGAFALTAAVVLLLAAVITALVGLIIRLASPSEQ